MDGDFDEASRFLQVLGIDETIWVALNDDKTQDCYPYVRRGPLKDHWRELQKRNRDGYGVFFTVNHARPGVGRKKDDIIAVRAGFVDLDGAPIEPVLACCLQPTIVVQSSRGRFHAYWRADDIPRERFEPLQKSILSRFGGDPDIHDLPRVMRLPGTWHQKVDKDGNRSEPFLSHIYQEEW